MNKTDDQDLIEAGVSSVLHIRCAKHYPVPQQNKNEHSGGECGGCIAEERDFYKAQYEAHKAVIDLALDDFQKLQGFENYTNQGLAGFIKLVAERVPKRMNTSGIEDESELTQLRTANAAANGHIGELSNQLKEKFEANATLQQQVDELKERDKQYKKTISKLLEFDVSLEERQKARELIK